MMKVGDRVPLELGGEAEITQLLGQGGQGAVYRASYRGRDYALKMYFTKKLKNPAMFRENLQRLCEDGSSSPAFVMPLMMTADTSEGFGFLMELIPPEYAPFSDILNARVKFSGLYSIVNAAIKITSAFRELHNSGRSYQDLNDGGFFIRPTDGDVLICDCDNIAPYGEKAPLSQYLGIPPEELTEQNAVHEVQSQTITKRIVDVWPWLVVSLLIVAGVEGSIFLLIVKRQRSYGDVREKRKKGKRSQSCRKTRRRK